MIYKILAKAVDLFRGRRYSYALKEMHRYYFVLNDIERGDYKNKIKNETIENALKDILYYKKRRDNIKARKILLKKDIQNNKEEFLRDEGKKFISVTTGGSTGQPLQYWMSRENAEWGKASRILCLSNMAFQPETEDYIFGATVAYMHQVN